MNKRRIALITGASRGIGRAISLIMAKEGYDIVGVARTLRSAENKQDLNSLKPLIEEAGASFLSIPADIADIDIHSEIVNSVINSFGRIDLLVNNAGMVPARRMDMLETSPHNFDEVLSVNLRGAFYLTQTIAKVMIEGFKRVSDYQPRIIFITSISADTSSISRAEYCISKAGLSMAARLYADRLAEFGINVYEIRPGITKTDMTEPVKEKYDKLIAGGLIPQNRWGEPEDVAKVVAAIARGDFDYSTGMIFEVSGGMNIKRL